MALGTLSVCLTVGILNLHHRGSNTPVPPWVRKFFLQRCARIFGFHEVESRKHYTSNSIKAKKSRPNNIKMQEFEPVADPPNFYEVHTPRHQHVDNQTDSTAIGCTADSYLMTETILNEAMQYHNITAPGSTVIGPTSGGTILPGRCSSRHGSVKAQRPQASHAASRATSPHTGSSASASAKVSKDEALDQELKEEIIREWHLLARVLDRILFFIVFLTMLCCALFILLSPWYAGNRKSFAH